LPLVPNNYHERYTRSKRIERNENGAENASALSTQGVHNILVGGAVVNLSAVDENEHRANYEDSENLRHINTRHVTH